MEISLKVAFICCKEILVKDVKMFSYTFCDLSSGHNFSVFSLLKVKDYETLRPLQVQDIKFLLNIGSNGTIKLKPFKEV